MYCKEVYTNNKCIQIKEKLIESLNGAGYIPNKEYTTKNQVWYINSKGYIHFIKGVNDILLTNNCTLKY